METKAKVQLQGNVAKSVFAFTENVQSFIEHFGIEHCGFLTLTFADHVLDVYEASSRFNSFRTGFLDKTLNILAYIGVYERQKSGRVHFHFVVAFHENIAYEYRKGKRIDFNHEVINNYRLPKQIRYASVPASLRMIWKKLREKLELYGFGIQHKLLPVRSDKGMARYLSKYLVKGIQMRQLRDKGFRLVRSSTGKKAIAWKKVSSCFAWNTKGSKFWREALSFFIQRKKRLAKKEIKTSTFYQKNVSEQVQKLAIMNQENYSQIMLEVYGPKWCYLNKDEIISDYQTAKIIGNVDVYAFERFFGLGEVIEAFNASGQDNYYAYVAEKARAINRLIEKGIMKLDWKEDSPIKPTNFICT
ncbi:rolling circle replication-associated protein [Wielerella bovis]|uniref:rolling circle replication-associated protein n=1 Tax=Wielerella bovis TaxID=2917790 RepID=UPI0020190344|nr:hypothetical protein [Wielerella bovis]ULJ60612.1 hypothetical protein MIS44_01670 [Wielerella bovis]ULJ60622.1 hypothetical protein MIS44_01720 [Wielerella bovis]